MNHTQFNCWDIIQSDKNVTSQGIPIGEKSAVTEFLGHSVPLFEMQLGIMLMMAHGLSFFLGRFGVSTFVCQILTGIILGPTILGRFDFMKEVVFPIGSTLVLEETASFGFLLHIFLITVDINVESAKRLTGKFAIITGLASVLIPIAIGLAMLEPLIGDFKKQGLLFEFLTLILVQSFSTFSGVVNVLKELKIRNAEFGLLLLSSAMISGGLSAQIVAAVTIFLGKEDTLLVNSCAYIGFIIVLVFVIRPGMNWLSERTPAGSSVDSSITCGLMIMALISEVYCQLFIHRAGFGVYTFGLLVPAGLPLGSALIEKFETFSNGVMLPVAIVITTMKADLTIIFTHFGEIRIYVLFVIVIGVVKMLSCLVPMIFLEIPVVDSVFLATIMTNRSSIEMSLCLFSSYRQLLNEYAYSVLISNILLTSIVVSLIVKRLYDPTKNYTGFHDRNVLCLKSDSQLRMLACIHDQDHIYSITRFLDAFRPTRERFLVLHALHLVPLTGLNTPMIIPHNKHNSVSDDSPSQNLIIHFNQYEQKNSGGTLISTYTSISPILTMNEDISILAFDQVASIIVLPFHRKWSIHGSVEKDDVNIRAINRKVLEKAPCSVAILFDRGKLTRVSGVSPVSICVIFLGGKDDWEALALAKRTTDQDTCSRLTIIHLMQKKEMKYVEATRKDDENNKDENGVEGGEDYDAKALEVMLKTYKQNQNIEYIKKFVKDGAETATEIRSIGDKYDLFMVGRRYGVKSPITSGLSEWTEVSELGVIGDMLACKDVDIKAAVFVVQQQRKFW